LNPQEIFLNRQTTWVLRSIGKSPVNSKSCAIIAPSYGISGFNVDHKLTGGTANKINDLRVRFLESLQFHQKLRGDLEPGASALNVGCAAKRAI
jgi:hypothetical protein